MMPDPIGPLLFFALENDKQRRESLQKIYKGWQSCSYDDIEEIRSKWEKKLNDDIGLLDVKNCFKCTRQNAEMYITCISYIQLFSSKFFIIELPQINFCPK